MLKKYCRIFLDLKTTTFKGNLNKIKIKAFQMFRKNYYLKNYIFIKTQEQSGHHKRVSAFHIIILHKWRYLKKSLF